MLALTKCSRWRSLNGRDSAVLIRSATRTASRSVLMSARTANSSPPKRAIVSLGRRRLFEPGRDRDQQLVAGGVAEAVVDELEPVEVEEEDRDRGLASLGLSERPPEAVEEEAAVRQAR